MATRIANPDIIQLGALYGGIEDVGASDSPSTTQPNKPLIVYDFRTGVAIGLAAGALVGFILNHYMKV